MTPNEAPTSSVSKVVVQRTCRALHRARHRSLFSTLPHRYSGGPKGRINFRSGVESISREHHLNFRWCSFCRAPRGWWNRARETAHSGECHIRQPGASGSRSILGVFADEASSTLWACSNDLSAFGGPATGSDTESMLKGFDLKTGAGKRSVSLPGSHAFCNASRWTKTYRPLCLFEFMPFH